ncbi:trans-aconitate 2-methyltransferase [Actinomadura sp. WMMB 499]|uniref:class I SAM-dependent methyltransferase n=1 Tax=Actinomadura sp. WMMB 499 TaxID=1219491 RepID=UPI0012441770|nr:class I SAM-dependent methyltransferase [Actinomadura sp. WMMB 499]QFG22429.1 class I SAM-dependent methyltransferase [Actinomadura sp. WMMB 499]
MTDTAAGEAARAERGEGYAVNAPYYDLIIPRDHWNAVAAALAGLLKEAGTIAEIGAGTGYFTRAMLESLGPDTEIFAIEPARVMRTGLVTRLAALEPGAAARVTVLPEDAMAADPGTPLDAVVLLNCVMHFAPDDRERLWRRWAERLRPGGLLIVEAQYPQRAEDVPASVVPGASLGRYRYETHSRAEAVGDGLVRWINTYRTLEGDALVREETAEFDCHVISDATLAAELAAAGLRPAGPDPAEASGLHVWRR